MDLELIYLFADILFTVGGWELGKRIWAAKGADPDRGKWYGGFLGFLLGFIGILTLLGISWRWHPASEPPEQRVGWTRPDRGSVGRLALLLLLASGAVFAGAMTVVFLMDAEQYSRWSTAMPETDTPVTRAACSEVTLDWDACFVLGAASRTDTQWKAEWGRQAQEAFWRAGIGLLLATMGLAGFIFVIRRQPVVVPATATGMSAELWGPDEWPTIPSGREEDAPAPPRSSSFPDDRHHHIHP